MGITSSRTLEMKFIVIVLLFAAAAHGAPDGDVDNVVPVAGSIHDTTEDGLVQASAFMEAEEEGPYVAPPAGWDGADACSRIKMNSLAKRWPKMQDKIKPQCEVKLKGKKWNKVRGMCRASLRFCVLYMKFAKKYTVPELMFAAKPHCKKAAAMHKKMYTAARKYERLKRKSMLIVHRKCMANPVCRRQHYRNMRKAETEDPPVNVHAWRSFVAHHKKCMQNKLCRKKYLHRRALEFRNGTRAERRCEYQRCMKNPHCVKRYNTWTRRHVGRKLKRNGASAPKFKGFKGQIARAKAKKAVMKAAKKAAKKAAAKKAPAKMVAAKKEADDLNFVETNMFNF